MTVIGNDLADAVEDDEQVLNVAQQLDAVVVSTEDLTRLRTPHPWVVEKGRFVKSARVERNWVFVQRPWVEVAKRSPDPDDHSAMAVRVTGPGRRTPVSPAASICVSSP